MLDFLSRLFDTTDFPARWNCGHWTSGHGWLHILSDIGIWMAYFAIPIILLVFAGKRPDVPFRKVFLLFGSFILACGTTHFLEAVIFWWPIYRFAGVVKMATAVISWATIVVLVRIVPEALALRSPAMLEREVERRTSELAAANSELQSEIHERQKLADELRRVAADLSESNRRKTEFLAILAHELRNPLAPLRNGIEILRLTEDRAAEMDEVLSTMDRQSKQLVHLIDDLLDVSRINQGKLQLRMQQVSLKQALDAALEATRPALENARHNLIVGPCPESIQLRADPTRITQIFANLLSNAARYTPDQGRIEVDVEQRGAQVDVRIRDNGIGIPAEMQAHVFDMFAQISHPDFQSQGGLGIGLTLVKRLTEMHGGEVHVESAGARQGATFTVTLPTIPFAADSSDASEAAPATTVTRRRVLVVDDNRDAAQTLKVMLEHWGHDVHVAFDGQEAVNRARELRPEVVFMDIGMPILNGYEAAARIRNEPWGADLVLVALSGWGQPTDRERATAAGFDQHLVKPANVASLRQILDLRRPPG